MILTTFRSLKLTAQSRNRLCGALDFHLQLGEIEAHDCPDSMLVGVSKIVAGG